MPERPFSSLLRHLQRLAGAAESGVLADGQLLERFVRSRDEAAFEVLVWRHGPMIWGLCRRLLRQDSDAEDAFQATFLTLLRKAASISKRASVASWLYKVAYRVALAARARAAKRASQEQAVVTESMAAVEQDPVWRDLRPVLDEEVNRLPEKYRVPFLLCYLEGKTLDEAAEQLGCPRGTVGTRLARARERLRGRLTRRGVTLSVGALSLVLTERLALAALPSPLVVLTLRGASATASGKATPVVSASILALVEGVVRTMFVSKLKTVVGVFVLCGVVGTGAGVLALQPPPPQPDDPKVPAEAKAQEKQEDRLPGLLKARLEAAEAELQARRNEFFAGRGTFDILIGASQRVLKAQRELSKNKQEQVAALEAHLRLLQEIHETNQSRFNAGRIAIAELKRGEFDRLDAEIELERAKAKQQDRLPGLLKARLEAAQAEVDSRRLAFQAGRGTLDTLIGASQRLLKAELEQSKNKDEEIAALQKHFELMREIHKAEEDWFNAGRVGLYDFKQAEFNRLEAEIALERAKAKK
jgi:RNA polymerase sigma factor (sigma-70 family)